MAKMVMRVNTQMLFNVLSGNSFNFFRTSNAHSDETLNIWTQKGNQDVEWEEGLKGSEQTPPVHTVLSQMCLLGFVNLFLLPEMLPRTPGSYPTHSSETK